VEIDVEAVRDVESIRPSGLSGPAAAAAGTERSRDRGPVDRETERVALPSLHDDDVVVGQIATVLAEPGQDLPGRDRGGHVPPWIENHRLELGLHRRRQVPAVADHDARGEDGPAVSTTRVASAAFTTM
jgi:hypothetical protein